MLESYSDILTVSEAQSILKLSKKSIYKLINNHEICARKVGKVYRISKKSICKFMGEEGL